MKVWVISDRRDGDVYAVASSYDKALKEAMRNKRCDDILQTMASRHDLIL